MCFTQSTATATGAVLSRFGHSAEQGVSRECKVVNYTLSPVWMNFSPSSMVRL